MMRSLSKLYFLVLFICLLAPKPAAAQSITAAEDGTGTAISSPEGNPNQYDIGGGTPSGANLFHSFEQFGLETGQVANFSSSPEIDNILGRVVGGDASLINGLLQVSGGSSNLFLINPAGIVFGPDAQFSLPADFTATTANGIQIGEAWFSALGSNDYTNLMDSPQGFAFTINSPGTIVNAGDIDLTASGRSSSVRLVGGTVVNTGNISTSGGGEIVIEAIPGEGIVTITPRGSSLSLGVPMETQANVNGGVVPLTPLSLPELLSNDGGLTNASVVVVQNGEVRLIRGAKPTAIPTDAGVAIVSGDITIPRGDIDVLGQLVALADADLDTSSLGTAGSVRIGGGATGQEVVQNADVTYVDSESTINASASGFTINGEQQGGRGGDVALWSDDQTAFYGRINARGASGLNSRQGSVAIGAERKLFYQGSVGFNSADAENLGELLLSTENVRILPDPSEEGGVPAPEELSFSRLLRSDSSDSVITIDDFDDTPLNWHVDASGDIIVPDGASLDFSMDGESGTGSGTIRFTASGSFLMCESQCERIRTPGASAGSNNGIGTIVTDGRDLIIETDNDIVVGGIETNRETEDNNDRNAGNVSLEASDDIYVRYIDTSNSANAGNIELEDGRITANGRDTALRLRRAGDIDIYAGAIFQATGVVAPGSSDGGGVSSLLSTTFAADIESLNAGEETNEETAELLELLISDITIDVSDESLNEQG
ncbi:MAG: filamentous hemagglutinin N-terminal domain-containing protein, partial [Cyanobacteria bacterium J06649_4]